MLEIEGEWGENISSLAKKMLESLNDNDVVVSNFNGIELKITKKEIIDNIVSEYNKACDLKHKEYIESNKYKLQKKERQIKVAKYNENVKILMKEFERINLDNHKSLLCWIYKIMPFIDDIDVIFDEKLVIEKLQNHGYKRNANTGSEFDETNSVNYAEYIIGQTISCLIEVGAIPDILRNMIKEWNDDFGQ